MATLRDGILCATAAAAALDEPWLTLLSPAQMAAVLDSCGFAGVRFGWPKHGELAQAELSLARQVKVPRANGRCSSPPKPSVITCPAPTAHSTSHLAPNSRQLWYVMHRSNGLSAGARQPGMLSMRSGLSTVGELGSHHLP
jgi:hypothetical protein